MITNASPHPWVEGDRSRDNTANAVSAATDRILMDDVISTRNATRFQNKESETKTPTADYLELAGLFSNNKGGLDGKLHNLESQAMKYYASQDSNIFNVNSGRFKGMDVPENLRCAIFQSNLAVKAGLISPGEVTVRAIEFGKLMQSKGYKSETFVPGKSYPNGTYIVGAGGGSDGENNHVGLVLNGKLMHTHAGRINYEAVSNKFRRGAYDDMRVYIPPVLKSTSI